jgi:protein-disulfide isomerase
MEGWPLLGTSEAAHIAAYFFDYTCDKCRELHALLTQIVDEDNSFAFVLIPIPGEPSCNPRVSRRDPRHANACALARLGLLIAGTRPDKYAEYDRFVFGGERAPSVTTAVELTQRLLNQEIFEPSIADAVLDPRIQTGIAIFKSLNLQKTPALLLRTGILRGSVATANELLPILRRDAATANNNPVPTGEFASNTISGARGTAP